MRRDPIVSGNISELVPIGLDGRPVYTNAGSFLDALTFNNKSHNDFIRHLAVPQMSIDGLHMDWYVPFEPSADKGTHDIVSWYDVDQKQRDEAIELFRRMESALTVTGRAMARQSSQSSLSTIARYLEKNSTRCLPALHFPGPDCIYFVDGVPVITFWGFTRNMKTLSQSPFECLTGPEAMKRPVVNDTPPVVFKAVTDNSDDKTQKSSGQEDAASEGSPVGAGAANRKQDAGRSAVQGSGSDSRGGADGMSRAVLILAASICLLTIVLLLKFLGVFDRADNAAVSAQTDNQIYLDSSYLDSAQDQALNRAAQSVSEAESADAAAADEPAAEAPDTETMAEAESADAAAADAADAAAHEQSDAGAGSAVSAQVSSEATAEQAGQENGIYLSEEYVDSQ